MCGNPDFLRVWKGCKGEFLSLLQAVTALGMTPQNQWTPWEGIFIWFMAQQNSWCEFEHVVTNITRRCSVFFPRYTRNIIFPAAIIMVNYYLTWVCISYYRNWSFGINKLFICIPAKIFFVPILNGSKKKKKRGEVEVVVLSCSYFWHSV